MFKLPDLPYASDALSPVLSDVQMRTHHDKHHAKYIEVLNGMLTQADESPASMEELVRASAGGSNRKLFNNAAQSWNHGFFWECMAPQTSQPGGELANAVEKAFGGLDQLKAKFVEEGAGHFASGWVWVVMRDGTLEVISTHDSATPLSDNVTPVMVCDLWEHAYYLDHKQDRKGFLEQWFDTLVNWRFVEQQYAAASGGTTGYRYPTPN